MTHGRHQPASYEWAEDAGWAACKRCHQEPGGRENSMGGYGREARTCEPCDISEKHRTIGETSPEAQGEAERW
jgi:hypothetical protein